MQFTTHQLLMRGIQPAPLLAAFARCFERPTKTTDVTMQLFWDQFRTAHRAIYRGGGIEPMEVAA